MSSGSAALALLPVRFPSARRPRIFSRPSGVVSIEAGLDAAELAADAGLVLDEWQAWGLAEAMAETAAGMWAAFEVAFILARQNGKNAIVEARQLAGLYTLHQPLQIHTAHEFKTTVEHFRRVCALVDSRDTYRRRVKRIVTSHGEEGIELKATPALIMGSAGVFVRKSVSPRLRFLARSGGSGLGFSCDTLYWDEAMILSAQQVGASMPTMSARWNPQLWYTASAGNELSVHLATVRERGMEGTDPQLLLVEYSIAPHTEFCNTNPARGAVCTEHDDPEDPASWYKSNPGMPHRLTEAYLRKEKRSMAPRGVVVAPVADEWARQRLSVGNWPVSGDGWAVIRKPMWEARKDQRGSDAPKPGRPVLAADCTPDQSAAAIGLAGLLEGDRMGVEIPLGDDGQPDHRGGTVWLIPRLVQIAGRLGYRPWVILDPRGPLGETFCDECEKAGLRVHRMTGGDVASSFAWFYRACHECTLVHLGQASIDNGLAGAVTRPVGDGGKAWARKATSIDICPLVAVTFAGWGRGKLGGGGYDLGKSVAGATAPPTPAELAPGLAAGLAPVRSLEDQALDGMY